MSDISALSSFCQNPRRVFNRYTGDSVLSPCGVCSSCVMNKRAMRVSSLMSYSAKHPHCLFVTLTYTDDCIPYYRCTSVDSDGSRSSWSPSDSSDSVSLLFDYEDMLRRRIAFLKRVYIQPSNVIERNISLHISPSVIKSYQSLLDMYCLEDDSLNSAIFSLCPETFNLGKCLRYISSRCSLTSCVPFPLVSDLQNFLKRLRKNILKHYGKKITYYAVSEYGPRSLRPHWHIMLFFDDLQFSEELSKAVRSCWLFGSCDTQLARTTGAAASYVASYINSYCSLPELYLHSKALRPRCLHSCGISSSHFFPRSASVEESPDVISRSLDGVGLRNDSGVVTVLPPSSYISRVFPRFRGIVGNDASQLYDLYSASVSLFRRYLEESGLRFSELKVSSFTDYFFSLLKKYKTVSSIPSCSALRFIASSLRVSNMHFKESFVRGGLLYYRFYRFFSKVLTFIRFWRINTSNELRVAVDAVVTYHSSRASLLLRSQYEMLSSLDSSYVSSYYSLCGYPDYPNSCLQAIRSYNDLRVSSSIKHKMLNDSMLSALC